MFLQSGHIVFLKDLPNTFDSDKFRSFQDSFDWKLFENDFENIIKSTYPEVVEIRRIMETYSSIFVVCRAVARLCLVFLRIF